MVAIKLRGYAEDTKNYMRNSKVMQDLRVSFKLSNDTYVDAVSCKDLYADLIEQAN